MWPISCEKPSSSPRKACVVRIHVRVACNARELLDVHAPLDSSRRTKGREHARTARRRRRLLRQRQRV